MVLVHGGTFEMGIDSSEVPGLQAAFKISSPDLFQDEIPRHRVTLDDFYLDEYLVTNAEFKRFVEANPDWRAGRIPPKLDNGNYLRHWGTTRSSAARPDHPVVNVNWYSAVAYCNWMKKRLPSEAEWEYAASGGSNVLFPWGDEPVNKTRANYLGSALDTTTPVGTYAPNRLGLFDMAGNVWEFLADEWRAYPATPQKNPVAGEEELSGNTAFLQVTTRRVIRGGSFGGDPVNLWVKYRDSHPPNGSREFVGFRCAK
jgi:sulfatase modifying factor 1